MSFLSKLLTSLVVVPGFAGVSYIFYEVSRSYPDYVQKIYDLEQEHGGCKFGLVQSKDSKTGGYPGEAIGSEIDKENNNKHKLKEVHKSIESSQKIQGICKTKPNGIVELFGSDTNSNGAEETGEHTEHIRASS